MKVLLLFKAFRGGKRMKKKKKKKKKKKTKNLLTYDLCANMKIKHIEIKPT